MSAATVLTAWIVLYAVQQAWEAFLTLLNLRHAARHAEPPPELTGVVDAPTAARMGNYLRARSGLALVTRAVKVAVTLAVIASGVLGILDRWVTGTLQGWGIASPALAGVVLLFLLGAAGIVLALPGRVYGQFVIEQRFGFNRMNGRTFVLDLVKSTLLSLVLGVPLLLGLFWFMATTGALWWIYAFAFIAAFQLVMTYLYQPLIAPLFNRFQPLEAGSLRERLVGLAFRLQFKVRAILVMDGSRRSRHSNAYFTGFGRAKRIVLFDTLLSALDEPQVEAVLAHEIGHEKRRHVGKHLALSLTLTLAGLWLMSVLLQQPAWFAAFGFVDAAGAGAPSSHAALIILSLVSGPALFLLSPVLTGWSRRHEYEADRYAVTATGGAHGMEGALVKLGTDNLSNLHPHPWYSGYHYSHPTLVERVRAIRRHAATLGAGTAEAGGAGGH